MYVLLSDKSFEKKLYDDRKNLDIDFIWNIDSYLDLNLDNYIIINLKIDLHNLIWL